MRSNSSVINVYKKNNIKSEVVTQLLYGDTFKKIEKRGSWIKIKNDLDHYKGFIKNKKFPLNQKVTHKICKLYANLYFQPNLKSKIKFGNREANKTIKKELKEKSRQFRKKMKELRHKTQRGEIKKLKKEFRSQMKAERMKFKDKIKSYSK